MVKVIGVDFSGEGDNDAVGKTWVTPGRFDGETLTIDDCYPVSRNGLEKLLTELPDCSVAAMDFPFSVPLAFAAFWCPSANEMNGLWTAASKTELKDFYKQVTRFTATIDSELLRVGDLCFSNAQPCLHMGRPNMVPMTFRGMQMMHRLWITSRFCVPPLPSHHKLPVLLEVMPGAALRNFGLPFNRYKDGKKDQQLERRENRKKILNSLRSGSAGIHLQVSDNNAETCIERRDGDGLDSLVAATVAARWVLCEADFCVPSEEAVTTLKRKPRHKRQASPRALGMTEKAAARREGWIYVPLP